ncbi:hypothetical protein F9C29_24350, partial [Enterobacter hormaechei]
GRTQSAENSRPPAPVRADGSQMVRGERRGKPQDAEALGVSLAEELLNNGAREILAEVYNGEPPA